ncbi:MAG TPA: NAD(P)H-dependent oxidoreductase subunit E [Nitrospira sp.]|jgi:NADH:ubiquinone oxidoreductase subunit E|nr:NAD(P)H-dependent oxidoreductase subunit E [Nitrospira sp.]
MATSETALLDRVLEPHRPRPGEQANILRTLLAVQQALGHVPPNAIGPVADALKVPEAHVAGVLSYYPDLHTASRGRQIVRVCLGEACIANRSMHLLADLQRVLGIGLGETTKDGQTTLERVYCLGNCGVGPTVMVDETIYGRASVSDVEKLLKPNGS